MIGIIGAMDIEVRALKEMLKSRHDKISGGIEFSSGEYMDKQIVVACCGIGKVAAAMSAQTMIIEYRPQLIINSGVAGALVPGLDIGDIAIGSDVVQHDMDTTAMGDPKGLIPGIDLIHIPCHNPSARALAEVIKGLGIHCLSGTVASGDKFVGTYDDKSGIAREFNAIACEMEGAAIGQVCYLNKVNFAVIRAISDSLSNDSETEYSKFCALAADNSIKVIKGFLKTC